MRKILTKIHTRLGLLSAPGLVLLGLTSLVFNHDFGSLLHDRGKVSWEQPIDVADTPRDSLLCARVRQALGLKGMLYWWSAKRGSDNSFSFSLKHPGKSYVVQVDAERKHARVEETRFGLLNVLAELHGGRPIDGSSFSRVWEAYNDVSVVFVVFAGVSGLYFWSRRRNARKAGWLVLSVITGGSFLLLIYLRLRG